MLKSIHFCLSSTAAAALMLCTSLMVHAAENHSYHLEKVVTIPSSDTGWDYNALDAARGHLFIAHRADGLHVYDTRAGKMIRTLERSRGTNTAALATQFDLGIA